MEVFKKKYYLACEISEIIKVLGGNVYEKIFIYHFEGSADLSDLYTTYYIKGISEFTISVVNYSDTTLTVKVLCLGSIFDSTVDSTKVYSGCSVYSTFKNLDASKRYCLLFVAPCNFKGYITIN